MPDVNGKGIVALDYQRSAVIARASVVSR